MSVQYVGSGFSRTRDGPPEGGPHVRTQRRDALRKRGSGRRLATDVGVPTSTYAHIPALIKYFHILRPTSILDIGLGNGKMGFIARDLLDVMLGERYHRDDWRVRIEGIEIFDKYIQAHQRAIYDEIHIGDAFDVIDRLGTYELVIIGDVLEHFDRDRATAFLDKAIAHCTEAIILSIPLGEKWTQDNIYGNEYERHRSFWKPEEFLPMAADAELYDFPGLGPYGSFLIRRTSYLHHAARLRADRLAAGGGMHEAIGELLRATGDVGNDLGTALQLAELYLQDRQVDEAIATLEQARVAFPDHASIPTYLTQLKQGRSAA